MRKIFTIALLSVLATNLNMRGEESTVPTPSGDKKEYVKTFSGCFRMASVDEFEGREIKASIVWGEENDVYFPDLISMTPMGSVAKGTLDGDKITIAVPQLVHHQVEDYGFMKFELFYYLVLLKEGEAGGSKNFTPVSEPGSVTFTVQPDGSVVLDALEEGYAVGLTQDNGNGEQWYGVAEYTMTYASEVQEAFDPAKLDKTSYSYITTGNGGQALGEPDYGYKVKVAFNGNDVYFFNLCQEYPDWWFKGVLDGTRVTVDNNQVLGQHAGAYEASLVFGKSDETAPLGYSLLPAETQFVFEYDDENRVFTTVTPEVVMFVNCIPDQLSYVLTKAENPKFVYQATPEGTPLDPWGLSFYFDEYGVEPDTQGYLGVNLPIVSTEGVLFDRQNMYYNIYLDNMKVEFTKDGYGMAEDSFDVPYLFMGNGISCQKFNTMHQIRLKPEGAKRVGVQVVNVYEGVPCASVIVEMEVPYSWASVEAISAAGVVDEVYYDLSGRRVSPDSKGLVVKRTLLDDGTLKAEKVVLK